jgi:hypothetical protein
VFLDANVLFSAAYGSSGLMILWERAEKGCCVLLASEYVIEEARRNLVGWESQSRLEELYAGLKIIPEADPSLPCPIDLSAKDQPVFMAALLGKATHFLTGDRRHYGRYFGTTVRGMWVGSPGGYLKG